MNESENPQADGAKAGPSVAGPVEGAKSERELEKFLTEHKIDFETVYHRPVFTVDESRDLKAGLSGGHTKNLFLKDKKGSKFLAVADSDTRADLVALGKVVGARGRLSFGSADLLGEVLGIMPGAVTPFTLLNPSASALTRVVFDSSLMAYDRLWFHPLRNDASTAITPDGLKTFATVCGFEPLVLDLSTPELA